jgi:endonuclease-3
MNPHRMDHIMAILKKEAAKFATPAVGVIAEETKDPYCVLISCILSLRTRDEVTDAASRRLFQQAKTPHKMITMSRDQIEKAIYPVSFYRNKSRHILALSMELLEKHGGHVPKSLTALLTLPGVGRKTANLVRTVAFGQLGICVDTHVHRISNRIGIITTKNADESEMALRERLPRKYWITYNDILVPYGQFVCRPISPFCSLCKISSYCDKVGVIKSR